VVYSIADCERLVQDSVDRINLRLPLTVPVLNCTANLNDVSRVIQGAKASVPSTYFSVAHQAANLATQLNQGPSLATLSSIKQATVGGHAVSDCHNKSGHLGPALAASGAERAWERTTNASFSPTPRR